MAFAPYLDQLRAKAKTAGLDLKVVAQDAGIPASTVSRWLSGDFNPSEAVARELYEHIEAYGG